MSDSRQGADENGWDSGSRLVGATSWHRFTAYTIEEGMIRPAPGATLEGYDPWQADHDARREEDRPYKVLLRLAQQADVGGPRHSPFLPGRQKKLLGRWLRENGLLGLLPHETLQFTTAAHWKPEAETSGVHFTTDTPGPAEAETSQLVPTQRRVRRGVSGWWTSEQHAGPPQPAAVAQPGDLVAPKYLGPSGLPVEAVYQTWPRGEILMKSLDERWPSFFGSSVLEAHNERRAIGTRDFASFADARFWREYGEPLRVFIHAALSLARPLAALEKWQFGQGPEWLNTVKLAMEQVNAAAVPASLAGVIADGGRIELGWEYPSLLACFAVMMLQDIAGGQRVLRCENGENCGTLFLSAKANQRFCSITCRDTYHHRVRRSRLSGPSSKSGQS